MYAETAFWLILLSSIVLVIIVPFFVIFIIEFDGDLGEKEYAEIRTLVYCAVGGYSLVWATVFFVVASWDILMGSA